ARSSRPFARPARRWSSPAAGTSATDGLLAKQESAEADPPFGSVRVPGPRDEARLSLAVRPVRSVPTSSGGLVPWPPPQTPTARPAGHLFDAVPCRFSPADASS